MRALILTLFVTGLGQLSNLVSGSLASHFLGAAGRGELEAAKLWPATIAYLGLFGLSDAILYASAGRRYGVQVIFAAGLWIGLGLSAIGMALGAYVIFPLVYHGADERIRSLAMILLLLIPVTILGLVFQELLRGKGRLAAWNAMRLVLAVGFVGFIGLAWLMENANLTGIGVSFLLANLLPLLLALFLCLHAGWGGLRLTREAVTGICSYGGRLHASAMINQINLRIDQMLIQQWMLPASLGLYVNATTYAQITVTLANSMTMVAFPRACAADEQARAEVIGLYLRLSLLLTMASSLILWVFAPQALGLLFGQDFVAAAPIARLSILGVIALVIREFQLLAFKAYDRALAMSKGEAVTLALNAGLLVLLAPPFGLMGAATAFVIVRWLSVIYLGWLMQRTLGLSLLRLFRPTHADRLLLLEGWQRARAFLFRRPPAA